MKTMCNASGVIGKREGSFLVEAIVALSLVVTGILGIIVLLTRSIGLTANVSQRAVATYLAAEGIEITKNIIDIEIAKPAGSGWSFVSGLPSSFAVEHDSSAPDVGRAGLPLHFSGGLYSYDPSGALTPFRRVMTATSTGDEVQVSSVVTWSIKGKPESVNLEDRFWNWRQ
ncbi:MAG: hypothetical protein V1696_01345 [Candidatus Jorgensenbacteria bacterium]